MSQHAPLITQRHMINGAAMMVAALLVVFSVCYMLIPEDVPVCADRYDRGLLFGYRNSDGQPLSAIELQARLAGRDFGVLENVTVEPVAGEPFPLALEVHLRKVERVRPKDIADAPKRVPAGTMFEWRPRSLGNARSACLSYSVYLPADFDFASGGALPGFVTARPPGKAPPPGETARPELPGLRSALVWRNSRLLDLDVARKGTDDIQSFTVDRNWFELVPGRWTLIEQEIELGEPGAGEDIVRVFVDGKFRMQEKHLDFGDTTGERFAGIAISTGYGPPFAEPLSAPKDTRIKFSPFALRWR